jgi:endoglucanase
MPKAVRSVCGGGCVGGWLEKGPPKTDLQKSINHLAVMAERAIRDPDIDHPSNRLFLGQALPAGYFAGLMQPAFAKRFKGLSESRIDEVMQSFAFRNCRVRKDLVGISKKFWME